MIVENENMVVQINKKAANSVPHSNVFHSNHIPTKSIAYLFGSNLFPVIFPFTLSEKMDTVKSRILTSMANKTVEIRTGNYATPKIYGSNARPTNITKFDEWFYEIENYKIHK